MKKTDLEKNKMLKHDNAIKIASVPDRFGTGSAVVDRREQRKLDQAAGLIPFACKLPSDLAQQLRDRASKDGVELNELVAKVVKKGLSA